jgi:4-amino-4-deoxy-L-arabinose transferase-like glycosyltransferase
VTSCTSCRPAGTWAWGYPDQPPLAPALARLVGSVAPDSLVALRLPSALMAAGVVLLTGMIARELGGRRAEQLLAAACMAVAGVLLGVAHLLSTTTIDLLAWVAVCWVGARILRGGDPRWWLAAGAILGVALLNKSLIAVLPVALLVGVLISGPRRVLTTRWFPLGVALAVVIVAPNLWWQAANGWPEVALSSAIAAGGSGTSEAWWLFLPYQLVLVSPVLVPVWLTGLVQLFRSAELRPWRSFGWAWVLLAGAFVVTSGKPYYLVGPSQLWPSFGHLG